MCNKYREFDTYNEICKEIDSIRINGIMADLWQDV